MNLRDYLPDWDAPIRLALILAHAPCFGGGRALKRVIIEEFTARRLYRIPRRTGHDLIWWLCLFAIITHIGVLS